MRGTSAGPAEHVVEIVVILSNEDGIEARTGVPGCDRVLSTMTLGDSRRQRLHVPNALGDWAWTASSAVFNGVHFSGRPDSLRKRCNETAAPPTPATLSPLLAPMNAPFNGGGGAADCATPGTPPRGATQS